MDEPQNQFPFRRQEKHEGMKDHVDAAERRRTTGNSVEVVGNLIFGEALDAFREHLAASDIRSNTRAYRGAGLKLVLRSRDGVEFLSTQMRAPIALGSPIRPKNCPWQPLRAAMENV
jgi:hypothetical protein